MKYFISHNYDGYRIKYQYVSDDIKETLIYGVSSLGFLCKLHEKISLEEWCFRIKEYCDNSRADAIRFAIQCSGGVNNNKTEIMTIKVI